MSFMFNGYTMMFRSGGVVVLLNDEYMGFFDTMDEAEEWVVKNSH